MTADTHSTTNAVALLALPPIRTLTEDQVRGKTCVWDGILLARGAAVDLGTRTTMRAGAQVRWFPRACQRCAHEKLRRLRDLHTRTCATCSPTSLCQDGILLGEAERRTRP